MRHPNKLLSIVLAVTVFLTACSTSWVSQAEAIVAVLVPAAVNVLQFVALLSGNTVSTTDVQLISTWSNQAVKDFGTLKSLLDQYNSASSAAKPGIVNQIDVVMSTIRTNLAALLPALHVSDQATKNKITAILGLVAAELDSMQALIPIVQGNVGSIPHQVGAKVHVCCSVKAPLNAKQFKSAYNATMKAKTDNPDVNTAGSHSLLK